MDFDPRGYSDMFVPVIQRPQNSSLMDNDTAPNGRSSSRSKTTGGRSRSSTNPTLPSTSTTQSPDNASLTRTISSPTPSTTTPRAQPQRRRGLFSILASAAQTPSTPPKSDSSSTNTPNGTTSDTTPPPSSTFMQNLARRLSGSSSKKQPFDNKNPAPQCPRRTLNVNHVRPRPEIKELEKIQLRRVCFVADETLISKRLFKATEPFETELPHEQKLKVKDLREAYHRACRNREMTHDDRVAKAFGHAKGVELRKLDLSYIKFGSKDSVVPVCDVLSLARGLEEVILDHCELTYEQLRIFLAALLALKPRSESEAFHGRGVAKLSLVGNNSIGVDGWRSLACFVHMNAVLVSLNISHIPLSMEAATVLARAIALPNPCRREIPPEFRLQPISPRPKQRKFSFRRGSASSISPELIKTSSPTAKRSPTVNEEIEVIEDQNETGVKDSPELPGIEPTSPFDSSFVSNMPSEESSSIVVVEPPSDGSLGDKTDPPPVAPPRRKVEELRMNHCDITPEILDLFVKAVTTGGVRYWDIGDNKFGLEGMKLISGIFTETKSEPKPEKEQENGRSSPTPPPSISSGSQSTVSVTQEEIPAIGKLEYLCFEGTDLSNNQLEPLLDVWLNHPNPNSLCLWALDLTNCRLGRDINFLSRLFTALERFVNFRMLVMAHNPLFANPKFTNIIREWLPRLRILRRLNLASTGMEAQHLVELARILPEVKILAALDISDNPIYIIHDDAEEREGQTEDVSGLTALEAAMRYCRQIIEVEIPEGGGVEGARLRHKIFLRCFKNIEILDHVAHPHATADPAEAGLGRKRTTTEDAKEIAAPTKEGRDKFEVDRGHGVARALETVLNAQRENKAQDDLLHRARKIKERLQPALQKGNQDEVTKRRLWFLNQVLSKVIDRFEEAYPECAMAPPNPKPDYEPDSSDEEEIQDVEEEEAGSPPNPSQLRRSSSMTELARGLELEEGDVHRFGSLIRKRNIQGAETELTGEQLLEAILKVDKETVEREVWDKDGLRKVLHKSIDVSTIQEPNVQKHAGEQNATSEAVVGQISGGVNFEGFAFPKEKKDTDSHSI